MIRSCGFWSSCVNPLGARCQGNAVRSSFHGTGAWKPPAPPSRFPMCALSLTWEASLAVVGGPGSQRLLLHCLPSGARFCLTPERGLFCLLRKQDSKSWLQPLALHLTLNLHLRSSAWRIMLLSPRACCPWGMQRAVLTETGVW